MTASDKDREAWHRQRIEELKAELQWHQNEARRLLYARPLTPSPPRPQLRIVRGRWKSGRWRSEPRG